MINKAHALYEKKNPPISQLGQNTINGGKYFIVYSLYSIGD